MASPKPMIGTAVREGIDNQGSVWKGFGSGTPAPKHSIAAVRHTPVAPKSRGLHTVPLGG